MCMSDSVTDSEDSLCIYTDSEDSVCVSDGVTDSEDSVCLSGGITLR